MGAEGLTLQTGLVEFDRVRTQVKRSLPMIVSSRGILAAGLGFIGCMCLVSPLLGQQESAKKASGPPKPTAPVIGTVDVDQVFKQYEKTKVITQQFSADMLARKNEVMRIMSEAQSESEMLAKLTPGTEDYKLRENKVMELKAKAEAKRAQAQRDFEQREAESLATIYKEIQAMVAKVAEWRQMNYVVKVSNQPITGTDPNSVMSAISSTVVYSDPHNDITNDVIHNLNRFYKAAGGRPAAKAAETSAAQAQPTAPTSIRGGER